MSAGQGPILTVGVTGFEPAASSSRTTRATKLRHTPWHVAEPGRPQRHPRIADREAPEIGPAARRPETQACGGHRLRRRAGRVATGDEGEQRRLGAAREAHRGVGRGAETGRDVQPRGVLRGVDVPARRRPAPAPGHQRRDALGAAGVEVAVRDERAVEGHGELAAVRVPGEHEPGAVGDHRVEDALVRRVDETHRQGDVARAGPATLGVPVEVDVRVVDPDELDAVPAHRHDGRARCRGRASRRRAARRRARRRGQVAGRYRGALRVAGVR